MRNVKVFACRCQSLLDFGALLWLGHLLSVNEIIMPTFVGAVAVHMTAHSHHQVHIYMYIYAVYTYTCIYMYMYVYAEYLVGACNILFSYFSFIVAPPQRTMKCELPLARAHDLLSFACCFFFVIFFFFFLIR